MLALAQPANSGNPSPGQGKSASEVLKPAQTEKQVTDEKATASPLDVATEEMRNYLKKMRILAIKYHLQDDPGQTKSLGAEWRKMLAGGHRIHDGMIQAAIAEFRAKPDLEGQAVSF